MTDAITFTVTHRGHAYPFSLPASTIFAVLHAQLEELTSVPPHMQKLLWKGKKATNDDTTLSQAGFRNGLKIQMLGSTAEEVGGLKAVEDEHTKRDQIMRERALKPRFKVCSFNSRNGNIKITDVYAAKADRFFFFCIFAVPFPQYCSPNASSRTLLGSIYP